MTEGMAPGDEAPEDAEGTGENVCADCAGSGTREGDDCVTCSGTGRVIEAIGGG
jgi:DnaJ-class molecular chaperone